MPQAVVDIGQHEMATGISFVALSRVKNLNNLFLIPFAYDRLTAIANGTRIEQRQNEEQRLRDLQ